MPADPYRTRAIVEEERDSTPDLGGWAAGVEPEVFVPTPGKRKLVGVLLAFGVFAGGFVANSLTVELSHRSIPSASAGRACPEPNELPAARERRLHLQQLIRDGRATPSERTALLELCNATCDPACAR